MQSNETEWWDKETRAMLIPVTVEIGVPPLKSGDLVATSPWLMPAAELGALHELEDQYGITLLGLGNAHVVPSELLDGIRQLEWQTLQKPE